MNNILDLLTKEEKNYIKYLDIKKGNIIFKEEEICKYLGVVMKGEISISSFSYNGKEIMYNKINKNEMFGNNLLFSKEPLYRGDVIALSDTHLALIDKNDLLRIFHDNESFLKEYLKLSSDFSKRLNAKIKLLSITSVEERFLYYVFINNNIVYYKSITNLAKEINVERETLSRLLSKLEKAKKIEKKNHIIKIDK